MLKHSYETCFMCGGDDYDQENQRIQCSACEYFVHQECLGDSVANIPTDIENTNQMEAQWTCQSCQVEQSLKKKFPGIDVSFKPQCVYCGLTGGLMRATTNVCQEIKKTPGCGNTSAWSAGSTNGITISNLTRKEKEYQIKLVEAKIKLWQEENEGKPFPVQVQNDKDSHDMESLQQLPEKSLYAPSFVYWAHMSCAQWLLLKNFVKKKPIVMKQVPELQNSEDGEKCEICGGSNGILQTCTLNKKKQGEDKILEELYKEFVKDKRINANKDSVMSELLDEMIEGGLCDSVTNGQLSSKNNKGCLVEVCQNKMHIECARRAEYFMKYDPEIETLEFYCSEHTPLPLKTELKQSIDDQITNITEFVENYQNILKDTAKHQVWTESEQNELFKQVASKFIALQKLSIPLGRSTMEGIESFQITVESDDISQKSDSVMGSLLSLKEWKVTLSFKKFPWQAITVEYHDSIDCWKKYWDVIGLSEARFRSQVMGLNKSSQIKNARLLKLQKQKMQQELKQQKRTLKVKEIPKVSPEKELPIDTKEVKEPKTPQIATKSKELPVQAPKKLKKKLTLKLESQKEKQKIVEQKIGTLRQTPERMKTKIEQNILQKYVVNGSKSKEQKHDEKWNSLSFNMQEKNSSELTFANKIFSSIAEKNLRQQSPKKIKRVQKEQQKKREMVYQEFSKIQSCYCKCPLSSIFRLKDIKKKQRKLQFSQLNQGKEMNEQQNLQFPSFKDKAQEEKYKLCCTAPGNRCTKSGITRCSNKQNCLLGAYFHVECCYNADLNFDVKKKARDKWFCLRCRERNDDKSNTDIQQHDDLSQIQINLKVVMPDVIEEEKFEVKNEAKSAQSPKNEAKNNFQDKKTIIRLEKKKRSEVSLDVIQQPSKRLKLVQEKSNLSEQTVQPLKKIEDAQPVQQEEIVVKLDHLIKTPKKAEKKQSIETELQIKKKNKMIKGDKFQTAPLIADLIKKVESTLPMSQKQQDAAFIELKKAIEAHTSFLKEEQEKKEIELKQKVEEKAKEIQPIIDIIAQNEDKQELLGEIEIKFDPVIKSQKVASLKKQALPQITPQKVEQQKQIMTLPVQSQAEQVTATKLSLSQQFLINLQRNQPIQIQKDPNINLLSSNTDEDPIFAPIQLQIDPIKLKTHVVSSKSKSKKTTETITKSTVKFDQNQEVIQNQPVTIAYFNNQQKENASEQAKNVQNGHQQNTSMSQSPPVHLQNPLEPKLAAGPASGYPQQAFNVNHTYQNGQTVTTLQQNFLNNQEMQQIEAMMPQPFVIDDTIMQQQLTEQNNLNERELAEIQRKFEKKERKRLRKAERKRREMEKNLIQIDTQQYEFLQEQPNSSLISICTNTLQKNQKLLNSVQLSTPLIIQNYELPTMIEKPMKKKKSKKMKEQAVDIVVDTGIQSSLISIEPTSNMPFIVPFVQQRNKIAIQNPQNYVQPSDVSIQMQNQQPVFNQLLLYPSPIQQMNPHSKTNDQFSHSIQQQEIQVQYANFIQQSVVQQPTMSRAGNDEFLITIPFDPLPKQSKAMKQNFDVTILQMEPTNQTVIQHDIKKKKSSKKL